MARGHCKIIRVLHKPGMITRWPYYIIGRNGRASGRWVWGQFAPMMPGADLDALLEKARADGTLLPSGMAGSGPADV